MEEPRSETAQQEETIPETPSLTPEERFRIVRQIGAECLTDEELLGLFQHKARPIAYDGFEPSGRMHVAQAVLKARNVNLLTEAGCEFIFWVADYFALMNDKCGGNLEKIQVLGRYFIEVWKALGMDMGNVKFLWSSEVISSNPSYLLLAIDIARSFTVTRLKRCSRIMGRQDATDLTGAQIMYPCFQCADIFFLGADICQLGIDQRKVNVLAREYCTLKKKKFKPVILSHSMLAGLKQGQAKMSKSDPNSAIFVDDTEADVRSKINKAYCPPPPVVQDSPLFDWLKNLVLPVQHEFVVPRKPEDGGDIVYTSYEEVEADWIAEQLHPNDLKAGMALAVNRLIQPIRDHFISTPELRQLHQRVKQIAKENAKRAQASAAPAPVNDEQMRKQAEAKQAQQARQRMARERDRAPRWTPTAEQVEIIDEYVALFQRSGARERAAEIARLCSVEPRQIYVYLNNHRDALDEMVAHLSQLRLSEIQRVHDARSQPIVTSTN
eukprot:gnl/Trimastix_PCT/542.p1 GENE.gnl/Trimastix_PCT/542~~gnl/Trimastix_PCT/542.p1  ORF type:complete len:507 (+),score=147.25 gnl/Trimastix_PCT/542:36-1523(+)